MAEEAATVLAKHLMALHEAAGAMMADVCNNADSIADAAEMRARIAVHLCEIDESLKEIKRVVKKISDRT